MPISVADGSEIESLLDRAFGPNRHSRTAYNIRGQAGALPDLSFAAMNSGTLVGSVQCWRVLFRDDAGLATPMVMLGPVAVDPARQQGGIGRQLVARALAAATEIGEAGAMMLIGDPEYYGRFFGFDAGRTSGWRLPGPFEPRRLLARGPGVPSGSGTLGPMATIFA